MKQVSLIIIVSICIMDNNLWGRPSNPLPQAMASNTSSRSSCIFLAYLVIFAYRKNNFSLFIVEAALLQQQKVCLIWIWNLVADLTISSSLSLNSSSRKWVSKRSSDRALRCLELLLSSVIKILVIAMLKVERRWLYWWRAEHWYHTEHQYRLWAATQLLWFQAKPCHRCKHSLQAVPGVQTGSA